MATPIPIPIPLPVLGTRDLPIEVVERDDTTGKLDGGCNAPAGVAVRLGQGNLV